MNKKMKIGLGILLVVVLGAASISILNSRGGESNRIEAAKDFKPGDFDHTHKLLDDLLQANVKDERVDYKALKAAPGDLRTYLGQAAAVTEKEFKTWTEEQQLAMLINLYNAATLNLIVDNYPVKSIKDIGSLFKKPWKIESLTLFGAATTLDHLEHEILRKQYKEPRIHFAIVCAAKGCPALRPSAFTPDNLDAQLNEQGEKFLRDKGKNSVAADEETVYLSKIFDWFEEDFNGGKVIEFVRPYFSEEDAKALGDGFKIKYTDYDWSLNEQ